MDAESPHGWLLHTLLQGQFTQARLTASDQLNIAGPYAVRGMRDAALLGDKAVLLSMEPATPVLVNLYGASLRGWGFVDYGAIQRNGALPGELSGAEIATTGLGLRGAAAWGTVDLYAARKLKGVRYDSDKGLDSVWLSAMLRF